LPFRALSAAGFLLVVTASQLVAADLPPDPKPPKVPSSAFDWAGLYVGVNGGGVWGQSNWSNISSGLQTGNFSTRGALIGGTAGYNWQTAAWVWGVETDLNWSSLEGTTTTNCPNGSCSTTGPLLGTVRGRLGYTFDRLLIYGTAGFAYGEIRSADALGSATTLNPGWAAGAGIEFGISGTWTGKVEYLYTDLVGATCSSGICAAAGPVDVTVRTNVIRAGINVRY